MRKALLVLALVVGFSVPVQAQGIFGGQYGPADALLQDNLDMVGRWMWYDDMYGFTRGGNFFGMYGRDGRRLSTPVRIAMAGVLIGTAVGAQRGGWKGALIGGGVGVGAGLIARAFSGGGDDEEAMSGLPDRIPPMPSDLPAQAGPRNGWNRILRNQANAGNLWFGSHRGCLEQGMATLKNDGRNPLRVYQNGNPFVVLMPRQSECGDAFASYEAEVVSMMVEGYSGTAGVARTKPEGREGLVLIWR